MPSNFACKNVLLLNLSIPSRYQMGVQPRLQQPLKTKEENINGNIYFFQYLKSLNLRKKRKLKIKM